ncbi:L-aspartate oxidase [Fuerstiella marisgermanici]|uniref:L-aspartate oxidase n=1 Tax=Fuerstiella marisgermanici TaxID=1891926 RepID=A0A1P8WK78_9PLAN|nr:L-aspartate oxidase [Fuerstiella marisgermanici]APZ94460.1 L-aspartate oxidase [Fuerstiella marisgermanici]
MQPDRIEVPTLRRYLVPFDPKRVPHLFADVLIIGAGIAGTRAALEIDPSLRTIMVTKDRISHSNSAWAQGGIAGVLDPLDEFANHVNDTIAAGKGMCDRDVVEFVIREAPERIRELIRYGADFDKVEGEIALTLEGGHSHPRVAHALGDATGKEVMRAMHQTAFDSDNIDIWQQTFTIDLLSRDGVCCGALVWNPNHGRTFVWAKQTILCTGGAGALYRETTNPSIATADGHALAFRAGCDVRDMEFMQFHPTVLYIAGSSRHLISEAVRGEGAHLVDSNGYRFMGDYNEAMELAPRDVVSQAITQQMAKTSHPCVYLDLTHIDPAKIRRRFPHIGKVCSEFGLDITTDRVPVRPGAHYMVGGVTTDTEGRTSLPGLWAAGEVTSTGLHGANRLASNSLLEGVVYGLRCGQNASNKALDQPDNFTAPALVSSPGIPHDSDEALDITDIRNSLRSLMWRNVGISRNEPELQSARQQLDFWANYVCRRDLLTPEGWELQNMMLVGRVMAAAALARRESRGVHLRSDYPDTVESLAKHITVSATDS